MANRYIFRKCWTVCVGFLISSSMSFSPLWAASLAYKNFTAPTTSYYTAFGPGIQHPGCIDAVRFVPTVSGALDHADVALADLGGVSFGSLASGAVVTLVKDGGGNSGPAVGPSLEEWMIKTVPSWYNGFRTQRLKSEKHPMLDAGTKYWLIVASNGFDGELIVWLNNTGATGGGTICDGGGPNGWGGLPPDGIQFAFDMWVNKKL